MSQLCVAIAHIWGVGYKTMHVFILTVLSPVWWWFSRHSLQPLQWTGGDGCAEKDFFSIILPCLYVASGMVMVSKLRHSMNKCLWTCHFEKLSLSKWVIGSAWTTNVVSAVTCIFPSFQSTDPLKLVLWISQSINQSINRLINRSSKQASKHSSLGENFVSDVFISTPLLLP